MTTPAAAVERTTDDGRVVRRYPIPNRETGEIVELANITGVIGVMASPGLTEWRQKMTALGLAHRDDLLAEVVAAHLLPAGRDRNKALALIIESAVEHGQTIEPGRGYLANAFGTAIHLLTEHVDAGLVDIMAMPTSVAEHLARYDDALVAHQIEIVRSEFSVYSFEHGYAGTGDRIIRFCGKYDEVFDSLGLGRGSFIADIKTGALKATAAMQLAALANAEGIYDATTGEFFELPADLRTDIGFGIHATRQKCDLVPFALDPAWPAFRGAVAIRSFVETKPMFPALPAVDRAAMARAAAQAAATPLLAEDPFVGLPDDNGKPRPDLAVRTSYLRDRVVTIGVEVMSRHWPADVPTFGDVRDAGRLHTADELDLIEKKIYEAEGAVRAPFPEPDPSALVNIEIAADDPRLLDIVKRREQLPPSLAPRSAPLHNEAQLLAMIDAVDEAETAYQVHLCGLDEMVDLVNDDDKLEAAARAIGSTTEKLYSIGPERADRFAVVCRALADRRSILTVRDGALYVDRPQLLIDGWGGRAALVRGAKVLALRMGVARPRSADEALADPLLVAALIVTETTTGTNVGEVADEIHDNGTKEN